MPGVVVLIVRQTSNFNDSLVSIWSLCVVLISSSGIAVILVGFHFLRKVNVVGSLAENNDGYLMDNDTIFILSTVGVIARKCIVLVCAIPAVTEFEKLPLRACLCVLSTI